MSLFAIIPIWLAALLCYLTSNKQLICNKPVAKHLIALPSFGLFILGFAAFNYEYPWVSALLATFIVFMLALIGITLLTAFRPKSAFFSVLICTTALCLGGLSYVA